jgi:hypothetical protein
MTDEKDGRPAMPAALAELLSREEFELIQGAWQKLFHDERGYAEVYVANRQGEWWALIDAVECLADTARDAAWCASRIERVLAELAGDAAPGAEEAVE